MSRVPYWIRGNLYLSVTNQLNSRSFLQLRGPSFHLPDFNLLPSDYEPNSEEMAALIEEAYDQEKIQVDSMKSQPITFAGYGDPLFRLEEICETAQIVRERRHGVPFRVKTNGLFLQPELVILPSSLSFVPLSPLTANSALPASARLLSQIAKKLSVSGIKHLSVPLLADTPRQYSDLIEPKDPKLGFHTVCNFIVACVDEGLVVTCTAIERPDIDLARVRSLSQSLGAPLFDTYSYHS
jgi:hypothetical protein